MLNSRFLSPSSTHPPFPAALKCPSCGAALSADAACSCAARTRLEIWNGIPRLLFGQRYLGECSSEKMAELLRRMESVPWRQALREVTPSEELEAHLTSNVGPEFVHGMPWGEIETALDIGSGMGFMTSLLAQRAKTVVALEAVPERALFQRKRAAQDGLANWHPLIASATALPFEAGTFDLVTLNGVFESIGLWGEGDPEALQRKFLADVLRVLKPEGYLYIGVETRFALNAFLGGRDHSGLAYTSLMPRRVAAAYCRARAVNFFGSEHRADGYRTYTYTPAQYKRMFVEAGFGSVEVYGVFDGYNRQKAVYAMDAPGPRRFARELSNPAASRKGRLLRWLANVGPWSATLEDEVVVFARKSRKDGPLTWPGLRRDGPITQFSSGDKVFVLGFEGDRPRSVFKGGKTPEAAALLAREYALLESATARHPDFEGWPLRWPKPLGVQEVDGRKLYEYEFARGPLLSGALLPVAFRPERFADLFARLVDGYAALCAKLTPAAAASDGKSLGRLLDRLAEVPIGDAACAARIQAACARLRLKNWRTQATHGDLSLSNALLLPSGGLALIDWENASDEGLVAVDLMRLLHDALHEASLLAPGARRDASERARGVVRGALSRAGVGPEDYDDVEALFVADQFRMWLSRDARVMESPWARDLLRSCRESGSVLALRPAPRTPASKD